MTRPGTQAPEHSSVLPDARPRKAIPPARDHLQSRLLVWVIMPILCALAITRLVGLFVTVPHLHPYIFQSVTISLCFAFLAWCLNAATPSGAACGGVICLCLIYATHLHTAEIARSAIIPLIGLFILTFLATRAGRRRKAISGLAESHSGRTASQVVANLGFAALFAFPLGLVIRFVLWPNASTQIDSAIIAVGVLSALAEATADTVSSEIGQAFGGTPFLLTTIRRVPPGTDGAITLYGTLAGITSAAIIAAVGAPALGMSPAACAVAFAAGVAGLFFDSLLGATVERKGWIGNDLVNFTSTAFAAGIGILAIRFSQNYLFR